MEHAVELTLQSIWAEMGLPARAVSLLLLLMAVAGLAVFCERCIFLTLSRRRSRRFAGLSAPLVAKRGFEQIEELAGAHRGSLLAHLVGAGLRAYLRDDAQAGDPAAAQAAPAARLVRSRNVLRRTHEQLSAELRRGLPLLSSVGSVAPFVGLLGTVVGIIEAFEGIARTGSGGLGAVSAGIAEALVLTALGLAVAIPAVLAYNLLAARAERSELSLAHAAEELLEALQQASPATTPGDES